jgi:TRAP-type C4-dicarboxylate transport system permease small subunit
MVYQALNKLCDKSCSWLERLSGLALTLVMVVTGCDVIGRAIGMPVPGTYEMVAATGGLIVTCALPMSYRSNKQIIIETVTDLLPKPVQFLLKSLTRLLTICVFMFLGYGIMLLGHDLWEAGEVTPVLNLPFYYIAYCMSIAFFVVVLVLVWEEICMWRSTND